MMTLFSVQCVEKEQNKKIEKQEHEQNLDQDGNVETEYRRTAV